MLQYLCLPNFIKTHLCKSIYTYVKNFSVDLFHLYKLTRRKNAYGEILSFYHLECRVHLVCFDKTKHPTNTQNENNIAKKSRGLCVQLTQVLLGDWVVTTYLTVGFLGQFNQFFVPGQILVRLSFGIQNQLQVLIFVWTRAGHRHGRRRGRFAFLRFCRHFGHGEVSIRCHPSNVVRRSFYPFGYGTPSVLSIDYDGNGPFTRLELDSTEITNYEQINIMLFYLHFSTFKHCSNVRTQTPQTIPSIAIAVSQFI